MTVRILVGDCLDRLAELPDGSVHCCVTSPPYWGLRDYGAAGQLGLEPTPDEYIARMVDVFREVRRVLRDDGTLWLNIGDSYAASTKGSGGTEASGLNAKRDAAGHLSADRKSQPTHDPVRIDLARSGLKPKDLVGIPWRVALALQADGWWLRCDIIWSKPNPMPESVTDRPTRAHEYVFLLSKSARYFYDADAVRESYADWRQGDPYPNGVPETRQAKHNPDRNDGGSVTLARGPDGRRKTSVQAGDGSAQHRDGERWPNPAGRNLRSVWTIATEPYPEAHFATFPTALVVPCVKAGTSERGVCPDCGAPWEREVELGAPVRVPEGRSDRLRRDTREGSVGAASRVSGQELARWRYEHPHQTTGWRSTCDHGEAFCPACDKVTERDSSTSSVSGLRSDVHGDRPSESPEGADVLLASLRERGEDEGQIDSVRGLRNPVHGGPAGQTLLLEEVRLEGGSSGSSECARLVSGGEGVHPALSPGSSDGVARGLRDGAPPSDGGAPRPVADGCRSGASPEREEGRQRDRESRPDAEVGARSVAEAAAESPSDRVPPLRRGDHDLGSCAACSSALVLRPLSPIPATVLDCFGGAGTTGYVAQALGRDAILIELNPEYAELARKRMGGWNRRRAELAQLTMDEGAA